MDGEELRNELGGTLSPYNNNRIVCRKLSTIYLKLLNKNIGQYNTRIY